MNLYAKATDDAPSTDHRVVELKSTDIMANVPTYQQLRVSNIALGEIKAPRSNPVRAYLREVVAHVANDYVSNNEHWMHQCLSSLLAIDGHCFDDWFRGSEGNVEVWKSPSTLGLAVHIRGPSGSLPDVLLHTMNFELAGQDATKSHAVYQLVIDDHPAPSETTVYRFDKSAPPVAPSWCFFSNESSRCRLFWNDGSDLTGVLTLASSESR